MKGSEPRAPPLHWQLSTASLPTNTFLPIPTADDWGMGRSTGGWGALLLRFPPTLLSSESSLTKGHDHSC